MSKLINRVRDRQAEAIRRALLREQRRTAALVAMQNFILAEAVKGRLKTFPGSKGSLVDLNVANKPGRIVEVTQYYPRLPWWKVWR